MIPIAAELTGAIEGGWEFVWAAYGITWATFILYTVSLVVRTPKEGHMTEAWKRRLFAIVALAIAGTALGVVSFSDMGEDLVYYWSPSELKARSDATNHIVRLGGQVEPGSIKWDKESQNVQFMISDGNTSLPVFSTGNPPQMFRDNIGVVVEGSLDGKGVFQTDKIMVKHSNEYKAPEEGQDMASIANTLEK